MQLIKLQFIYIGICSIKLEFQESDVLPGKTNVKQGKIVEFISPAKGGFREMYKSQNISPISLEAGGMAVCSVALRADELHIHDFMIVPCVVNIVLR